MQASVMLALIFAAFFYFMYLDQNNRLTKEHNDKKPTTASIVFLAVATVLKILIAPYFKGYEVDMGTYTAWMQRAALGLNGFYADGYFCDYPPLYIMMTGLFGWIRNLFGGGDYLTKLFVKMPGILAEGLIGYELLRYYCKVFPKNKQLPFAVMLSFLPSFLITGTYWGQTDGIFCYLMLLTFRFVLEDKLTLSALMFTLSALTKPQSFLFAPLIAILFAKSESLIFVPKWKTSFPKGLRILWNLALTFAFSLAIMSLSVMPFRDGVPDLRFLISKYTETFSSYPYASLNTFNLFGLLGGNMVDINKPFLFLTYAKWGTILMAICVLGGMVAVWFNRDKKNLFLIFGTYLFAIVMLGSKMHERYWYFVPILLLLSFVVSGKKKYFGLSCVLNLSYFLNLYFALEYLGGVQGTHQKVIFIHCTLVNLSVLVALIYDVYTTIRSEYPKKEQHCKIYSQRSDWKSVVAVLCIMLIFGGTGYARLGSRTHTPQTYAKVNAGETVTFRFDSPKQLSEIQYFVGYGLRKYQMIAENDTSGQPISLSGNIQKSPYVFSWQEERIGGIVANAVKLQVLADGSDAVTEWGEFVFYDEQGTIVPYTVLAENPATDVSAFSDEPFTVPEKPSYENSFYFDEIYHARTAYEYMNGLPIYETTHPPLGKLLITVGIGFFGWNPFGYRFMGVLFGILMIPFLYHLAKRLFRYRWVALLVTVIFTFDFMHLSHSRIASIDAFMVFFILASFTFMAEFMLEYQQNGNNKRSLLFLGLSGGMFGCGAAVKWAAIYAGIGLFVLYLYAVITRYKAKKNGEEVGILLLASVGLYALLPFAIYYFSYLDYFRCFKMDLNFVNFWSAQKHMFNYHSGLTATHPYSAAWYEWLLDLRPLWMHQGVLLENGQRETIATMGNPILLWGGLAGVIYTAVWCIREKKMPLSAWFIFAGFSQMLPWIMVSRVTFMYHYFPMLAFLALALGFYWEHGVAEKGRRIYGAVLVCVAAVVLFGVFYPVLTGIPAPQAYVDLLKILPNWVF